ncbi:MAG: 16S rRNA (guanine(527)-N(7))-methyltransferase RsmG [Dehalococcoidia bacterium]|nr:16S rRNA (guanine(527)-N(7))-methyltransferase RsmG [Dehalococcoidia bacterium]
MNDRLAPLLDEAARLGLSLTEPQRAAFEAYLDLIEAQNEWAGITSIADPAEMQRRHFGESLALLVALRSAGLLTGAPVRVADLGPGGGFPGLPMRIVAPSLRLTLIESHGRRCDFMREVVATLGLEGVEVVQARAEDAGRQPALREGFDLVIARALAAVRVLVEYGLPLLKPGGVLATPKGSRWRDELEEAGHTLSELGGVTLETVAMPLPPGVPEQAVVLVRREGPLSDRYPRRAGMPVKRPL